MLGHLSPYFTVCLVWLIVCLIDCMHVCMCVCVPMCMFPFVQTIRVRCSRVANGKPHYTQFSIKLDILMHTYLKALFSWADTNRNDAWDKPLHLNDILNGSNTNGKSLSSQFLCQPNQYVHTAHTTTGTTLTTDHYYTSLSVLTHCYSLHTCILPPCKRMSGPTHFWKCHL